MLVPVIDVANNICIYGSILWLSQAKSVNRAMAHNTCRYILAHILLILSEKTYVIDDEAATIKYEGHRHDNKYVIKSAALYFFKGLFG